MEEPDYDDLIEDYMEDFEEPAPAAMAVAATEYDDDFLEEMEAATCTTATATATTNSTREVAPQLPPSVEHERLEQESASPISTNLSGRLAAASPSATSPAAAAAAQVRSDFTTSRNREGTTQPDIFSFERYNPSSSWRQDTSTSPTTMRARGWKSNRHNSHTSTDNNKNHQQQQQRQLLATTPEAQLLQYQQLATSRSISSTLLQRQSHQKPIRISRRDKHMSILPKEGQASVPMTLGDGNRVFVHHHHSTTLEEKESSSQNHHHTTNETSFSSLGISMTDLIRRVQAIQRKKEHDRLKVLSKQMRTARRSMAAASNHQTGDDDGDGDDNDNDDDDDDTMEDEEPTQQQQQLLPAVVDDQLWVDKHAPSTFANLLSDEKTNREVLRALREWDPYVFNRDPPPRPKWQQEQQQDNEQGDNNNKATNKNPRDRRPEEHHRVILLSGPPGVGKTTLAHIVARHCGYRPMEVNGSDDRSASVLTERVVRAMETATLDMHTTTTSSSSKNGTAKNNTNPRDWRGRPNCLILDEIDGADAKQALQALVELIRQDMPVSKEGKQRSKPYLKRPIIFICNNLYAPALRPLLPFARRFQVSAPAPPRLVARLRAVLSTEGLSLWGGATLLHDLVTATGGDIRSCLYTLQFAAAEAHQPKKGNNSSSGSHNKQEDISKALMSALNGNGMKDDRTDVAGTTMTVFRKARNRGKQDRLWGTQQMSDPRTSVERVLEAVESFGEHAKILDCLYLNLLNVSYIDPTFDRCAAALQWLSGADLRGVQHLYVPCAAAALHLLCRVEQKPDLTYTTRALTDTNYQREANLGLTHKFSEGLSARYRGSRSADVMVKDTIPYALWMLSAGEGSSGLGRPASSYEILNKREQASFQSHVETLHSLGLTYVAAIEEFEGAEQTFSSRNQHGGHATFMILEPPIERLVQFNHLNRMPVDQRKAIPSAMKELLARRAELRCIRESGATSNNPADQVSGNQQKTTITTSSSGLREPKPHSSSSDVITAKKTSNPLVAPQLDDGKTKRREVTEKEEVVEDRAVKRQKVRVSAQNFLGLGAKRAKEVISARRAKNVGFIRSKSDKRSNTGSGIPFGQVLRLKYVKGFTQAVRNPCRLDDLA